MQAIKMFKKSVFDLFFRLPAVISRRKNKFHRADFDDHEAGHEGFEIGPARPKRVNEIGIGLPGSDKSSCSGNANGSAQDYIGETKLDRRSIHQILYSAGGSYVAERYCFIVQNYKRCLWRDRR